MAKKHIEENVQSSENNGPSQIIGTEEIHIVIAMGLISDQIKRTKCKLKSIPIIFFHYLVSFNCEKSENRTVPGQSGTNTPEPVLQATHS